MPTHTTTGARGDAGAGRPPRLRARVDAAVRAVKGRFRDAWLAQRIYRLLNWHLRLGLDPTPWSVALETSGPCNRACSYCPVSLHARPGEMPRPLFDKVIDDLAAIGFSRTLSFHFYNEPLLDPRLPDLIRHARTRLPRCQMDVFTNGDHLSAEWIDALLDAGLQVIRVSLHSKTAYQHLRRVLEQVDAEARQRVLWDSFWDREATGGFLYNRVEMAEARPSGAAGSWRGIGCSLANSLMINFEGDTALCCNDFFAANGHGSLATSSVKDVWRRSRPVRRRIYLGTFDLDICRVCNVGAP